MGKKWEAWLAWNRRAYLGSFERRLNRVLWGTLLAALLGAALQHVFLANVPEFFPAGARWGELLYDLAIGYVASFVFYLLVVRVPLRRDRENYYSHLRPLIVRLVSEARDLMVSLNRAAGLETAVLDTSRLNTQANIREMLGKIRLDSEADHLVVTSTGVVPGTVADVLAFHVGRARKLIQEILTFAPFYDSEVVKIVAAIDDCHFFRMLEVMDPQWRAGETFGLVSFEEPIFDYLQLADRLNEYRAQHLPTQPTEFSELITGKPPGEDSPAVPLSGEIASPPRRIRRGTKTVDASGFQRSG